MLLGDNPAAAGFHNIDVTDAILLGPAEFPVTPDPVTVRGPGHETERTGMVVLESAAMDFDHDAALARRHRHTFATTLPVLPQVSRRLFSGSSPVQTSALSPHRKEKS